MLLTQEVVCAGHKGVEDRSTCIYFVESVFVRQCFKFGGVSAQIHDLLTDLPDQHAPHVAARHPRAIQLFRLARSADMRTGWELVEFANCALIFDFCTKTAASSPLSMSARLDEKRIKAGRLRACKNKIYNE